MTRYVVVSYDPGQEQTFHDVVDVCVSREKVPDSQERLDAERLLAELRIGRLRDYAHHVATYTTDELEGLAQQVDGHRASDVEKDLAEMEASGSRAAWDQEGELDVILREWSDLSDMADELPVTPGPAASAIDVLLTALRESPADREPDDIDARRSAAEALGRLPASARSDQVMEALRHAAAHDSMPEVREAAAAALGAASGSQALAEAGSTLER